MKKKIYVSFNVVYMSFTTDTNVRDGVYSSIRDDTIYFVTSENTTDDEFLKMYYEYMNGFGHSYNDCMISEFKSNQIYFHKNYESLMKRYNGVLNTLKKEFLNVEDTNEYKYYSL